MHFYDEEISLNGYNANLQKIRIDDVGSKQELSKKAEYSQEKPSLSKLDSNDADNSKESSSANMLSYMNDLPGPVHPILKKEMDKSKADVNVPKYLSDIDAEHYDEQESANKEFPQQNEIILQEQSASVPKVTLEKIQNLDIKQNLKDIIQYTLKYTTQNIETPYQLQPFIPEYVASVGDVDAFLKVRIPHLLKLPNTSEKRTLSYLNSLGLCILDEPSGTQSEPRLLNIKLNNLFSSDTANFSSGHANLAPIARNVRDIDKWIEEVEHMHMLRSMYKAQPLINIDEIEWNNAKPYQQPSKREDLEVAFNRYKNKEISFLEYVRLLCNILEFDKIDDEMAKINYIQQIFTLFCITLITKK